MPSDPIFALLAPEVLDQAAKYLKWNPQVSVLQAKSLSDCSTAERWKWLDTHRAELEDQISWIGTAIFSYAIGNAKSYRQIVVDLTLQLGVPFPPAAAVAEIEARLITVLWSDILSRMTPEQRGKTLKNAESIAAEYGSSAKKEMLDRPGERAEPMSSFGVYIAGSVLLGALNLMSGLAPRFGAAIVSPAAAIGMFITPIGWAALGLSAVKKLTDSNSKKLLPLVILVGVQRAVLTCPEILKATQALASDVWRLKRIKITCRCGGSMVEETFDVAAELSLTCPSCGQMYRLRPDHALPFRNAAACECSGAQTPIWILFRVPLRLPSDFTSSQRRICRGPAYGA